jgi:F-type H+-transporting ATPase subunit epsilon
VLPEHAPLVTVLRPGVLTVTIGSEKRKFILYGGFAEVGSTGLTILADMATSLADLDRAALEAQIREQEEKIKEMEQGSALDRAITRLDHFKALQHHMAGTAMH